MILDVLYGISIIIFLLVIPIVIKKRKNAGVTGIKSALTPICFLLITLINILAYWFDFLGLFTWFSSFALVILAAYFTKYFPSPASSN